MLLTKVKNIRIALIIWGFFVILAGLIVEAALVIPKVENSKVKGSAAECPGEYRSNIPPGGIPESLQGGFWGYYKCEGQTSWNACTTGGVYSAGKPVFDPNFCGMQQIDYCLPDWDDSDHDGITNECDYQVFESCLITDCSTPVPNPPPAPNSPSTPIPSPSPVPTQNPNFEIAKDVIDPDTTYNIGETVNFRVTIRNTGDVSFDTVKFRDIYNPSRLDFLSARGNKNGGADVVMSFTVDEATGIISHNDLTTVLENLEPGGYYQLTFSFRALSRVSRTCNEAFTNPDNMGEKQDDACLAINEMPVPITDL